MTTGIYCITSPSNKTYIGSSVNIERRWGYYKRLDCKGQKALYTSLTKYGLDNHKFEVIWVCTEEELLQKEQMLINFYKPELNIAKVVGRPAIKKGCEHPRWKGGISLDAKEYKKEHYQANKEQRKVKDKEYRKANKDKIKEHKKQYYQANREKLLKRQKECLKETISS